MKQVHCEREGEIIQALRGGTLDAELEKHAGSCAICADTLAVSKLLRPEHGATQADGSATRACPSAAPVLPDSDFLWWKAQLAGRQMAVERATRSIALVKKISGLGIAAAGLWLVFAPGHLGLIMDAVAKNQMWPSGILSQGALFLGAGALALTLLGSLYLARLER